MVNLREVQSRFFSSIARISEEKEWRGFDPALVRLVQGRGQLGPEARLDIYAQMYCARLLDILHEDFSRVAEILGDACFYEIARAYLRHYPSTNPSVRCLGAHFASFLETRAESASLPFLADLARLEWARLEAFDAPDTESLRLEHLQVIPLDEWPELQFRLIPACQILHCAWPIHEIWVAAGEGTWQDKQVRPAETVLRIWRDDFTIYQASMDVIERRALAGVWAKKPFAAICTALESLLPAEEAAPTVGSLLIRWIEDRILAHTHEG